MKSKLLHKVFSIIASLSLLVNPLLVPVSVMAQEVVDNTAQEETQTPTPEPTVEVTSIPLEEPIPTPDVEVTPIPTEEPVLIDATVEADVSQSTETLEPEVIEDISLLPESDIEAAEEESSAQLTPSVSTDKADYAPTETVVINGSDFPINSDLAIRVTWPDGNIRSSAGEIDATDTVLTDEIGSFIALYDLRGEGQEGEYLVEVLMGAVVLRTTTFTDGPLTSSKVGKLEQWKTAAGGEWITGALIPGNSDYSEGEAVPFRLDVGDLPTGDNPYTFSVCRDYQNGTSFGYLNLEPYNTSRSADAGGAVTSTNGPFSGVNINIDSIVEVGGPGVCGANERETQVALTSSGAATAYVLWGGHLASPVDPGVGTGNGASSYSGGSLHMSIEPASKDLSIQTSAIIPAGSITIIKDSQPNSPQDFSFTTTGESLTSFILDDDADSTLSNTEVFNGLTSGTYTITEETTSGWALTSKSCVSSGTESIVIETTNGVSIDYIGGEDITCTFTNTGYGTITVRKDVEPDDGSIWDFTLTVGGYIDYAGPLGDGGEHLFSDLSADTYWLYETTKPGYDTSVTCDSGESGVDDVLIDLALGEDVICTFVNKPKPQLTLEKIVVNDDGGQAQESDWTLFASGDALGFSGSGPIVGPSTVNATVVYTLSESGPNDYLASSWSCNGGTQVGDQITLSHGNDVTCTIENDDIAPTLTLIKTVVNNNGGTKQVNDFPLFINAVEVVSGIAETLMANVPYTASETEYFGYAASDWGGDCNSDGTITLQPGDNKTCTITNDDIAPILTLIKNVNNNDGGNNVVADFLLFIDNLLVLSGVPETLDAGSYTASEQTVDGYTPSVWTGGCEPNGTVVLLPGDNKTCTITNDDVAPTITLIKNVINNNGGTAGENDFGLTVGGIPVDSGETVSVLANTPIALDEVGFSGYGFVSITGDEKCPDILGGTVTLDEGEDIVCTITNDDIAPTLTLIKHVINDDGGTNQAGDFNLYIDGNPATSGVSYDVEANVVHTASEDSVSGYTPSDWYGDCDNSGSVTLLPGENKTCDIDNDDIAPTLTLHKEVITDDGGTATANDFQAYIDGNSVPWGQAQILSAGSYQASEDVVSGYSPSSWSGDCDAQGNVILTEGDDLNCYITNDDIAPKLTLIKSLDIQYGGTASPGDWYLVASGSRGFGGTSGVNANISANEAYYLTEEDGPIGYTDGSWNCTGGDQIGNAITLQPGDDVTCTITNSDQPGEIHGMKFEDENGNGIKDAGELGLDGWTINITDGASYNGSTVTNASGEYSFTNLSKGVYTLTENLKSGWKQTTPDPAPVDVDTNEVVQDIDFGNFELGRIQGRKYQDLNMNGTHETNDEDRLNGWTMRLYDAGWNELDEVTTSNTGAIGQYRFEDLEKGTYYACEVLQGGWMQTGPIEGAESVDNSYNPTGDGIAVFNGSGQGDEGNVCWRAEILESEQSRGWLKFGNIEKQPEVSNIKTRLGFEEVLVGDPTSFEIEIENTGNMTLYNPIVEDTYDADYLDFVFSSPIPPFEHTALGPDTLDYDNDGDVTENISILRWALPMNLDPGDTYTLTLHFTALKATDDPDLTGNTAQTIACVENSEECGEGEEVLSEESRAEVDIDQYGVSIAKSNDKSSGASAGDTVNYTLEVTNTGDWDVLVNVTDVLPGGFTYVVNSAKVNGIFQEPNLSSPGKLIWENVFVLTGNPVTITYQATISSDIDQGVYTNLATCRESVENGNKTDRPTEREAAECNIADSSVPIGVNFTYSDGLRGEVLGAATELPATGNDTKILIMLLATLALGASLKVVSYNMAEKKEEKNV